MLLIVEGVEVVMCRKLILNFGIDAKHKQGLIWYKASFRPTSWCSKDYRALPCLSLGYDDKGVRSRAMIDLFPES